MVAIVTPAADFGVLLRGWRQRRRFSQLDLAGAAEVSTRHLSFLETGRSKPSREMVLHLAEHLDVPLRERNALLLAAGFSPAYPVNPLDDDDMAPVRAALDAVLAGHGPNPALVVDRHWDLVSANDAAMLFVGLAEPDALDDPVNVVRTSIHPRGLAPHILNFEEYTLHMAARLRRQVDHTADPRLAELYTEVMTAVGGHRTHTPGAGEVVLPLRLRVGEDELTFFSTISVFGAPYDVQVDELAVEAFYPADEATARYLRRAA